MAPKSAFIFFAILSVVAVAVPIVAGGSQVGGWRPISNPKAPEVVAIAEFAVTEYNKENKASLVLVSVLKGETQVVAGTNYRLVITVKGGGAAVPFKTYTTVVHSSPSRSLSLLSFQPNQD